MAEKEGLGLKRPIPPYLPYKTLRNFVDSMKVAIPARIDRSLMRSMAGGLQSQLIAGLGYLNLINTVDGVPTERLTRLVHSEGADRQRVLKEILTAAYPFLFKDGFDLERTTALLLQERFSETGVTGDTMRKCIAFFMRVAKDAGIKLPGHLKKTPGRPRLSTTREKRKVPSPRETLPNSGFEDPSNPPGEDLSLEKLLLSKFPSFDPAWPDEVKTKWFEGFNRLMEQFKK